MARSEHKNLTTWMERLTLGRAIRTILILAILLIAVGGALARLVEPETFTSLGLSYWWAVTTVTTVGYGDVVPHDTAGRFIGAVLMLTGLSLIPLITSVAVSVLAAKRAAAERSEVIELYGELSERLARIEQHVGGASPRTDAAPPSAPAGELPPPGRRS